MDLERRLGALRSQYAVCGRVVARLERWAPRPVVTAARAACADIAAELRALERRFGNRNANAR